MKKIQIVILCALLCIALFGCGKSEAKESIAESTDDYEPTTKNPYIYEYFPSPAWYESIDTHHMKIVEWGERIENIGNELRTGYAVKYVNIIDSTFKYGFPYDRKSHGFNYVENGDALGEAYDNIIIVPSGFEANKGDLALIRVDYNNKISFGDFLTESYETYSFISVRAIDIFPIVDGKLVIPDEVYEIKNDKYAFEGLGLLLEANENIRKLDSDFPIFENGLVPEDIERYYDKAVEIMAQVFKED